MNDREEFENEDDCSDCGWPLDEHCTECGECECTCKDEDD